MRKGKSEIFSFLKSPVKGDQGFTLVELAVVMITIGVLIVGILKGQEIITNGKVTATAAQIRGYDTAAIAFMDLYNEMPGTIRAAGRKLPNCAGIPACEPTQIADNGRLDTGFDVAPEIGHERTAYFLHMAKAGFIGGIDEDGGMVFSGLFPEAELKGVGFHAGYVEGGIEPDQMPAVISDKVMSSGHYLALHSSATSADVISADNSIVLTPNLAARIDLKLDDGSAVTGRILAFGDRAAGETQCASVNGTFAESNNDLLCGLYIRTPR